MDYKIAIDTSEWLVMVETAEPDKDDPQIKHLKGDFMRVFEKKIEQHEKISTSIKHSITRLYTGKRRKDASFLTINAICKLCGIKYKLKSMLVVKKGKEKGLPFYFLVDLEPDLNLPSIIIDVKLKQAHSEHIKSRQQIRGSQRKDVAKDIIIQSNGSLNDYYLRQLSQNKPVASEEVYRKLLSEYHNNLSEASNNKESGLYKWFDSLCATSDSFESSVKGKKLNGFIQSIKTHKEFNMFLYTEKQFECIRHIPKNARILHFNAT